MKIEPLFNLDGTAVAYVAKYKDIKSVRIERLDALDDLFEILMEV